MVTVRSGERHLEAAFALADPIDCREALVSYQRYHDLMLMLAEHFDVPLRRVVAAFVALSPNNDYIGNLRSLTTLLHWEEKGQSIETIQCSTYRHCLERAYSYVIGTDDFEKSAKGPKIRNFYFNILDPSSPKYVTIDGHISGIWSSFGKVRQPTMKQAIVKSKSEYNVIAHSMKKLAFKHFLLPNQFQATLWFTRKRLLRIKYNPQYDLFYTKGDAWQILRNIRDLPPFPLRG